MVVAEAAELAAYRKQDRYMKTYNIAGAIVVLGLAGISAKVGIATNFEYGFGWAIWAVLSLCLWRWRYEN